jgi:hypothetical protein
VGEVEALPDPVRPSRVRRSTRFAATFPPPHNPPGIVPPIGAVIRPVAAIRFTAPASPFPRPCGLPGQDRFGTEAPNSSRAWTSLQGIPYRPRRSPARLRRPSWGLFPFNDIHAEVHEPGLPHPVCSAFRVSRPLDGFLPPTRPGLEDRCRSWGFTLQSFSPPQSRSPCGGVALLPFVTSRAPALRTKRSRCPAAPGPCSPRRSVPEQGRTPPGPMLSWALSLLSVHVPASRGPVARPTSGAGRSPKARSERLGPWRNTETGLEEADRHGRSSYQDLSPDSPDDSSVLSESSDWK